MKGSYILLIELSRDMEIQIGKLGRMEFRKGFYAYVGSAMNNLEKRVERHIRKEKRLFWHIDYLLENAEVKEVIYTESGKREECKLAKNLGKYFTSIRNFGSSDCKCGSHLFFSNNLEDLRSKATMGFKGKILRKNLL